MEDGSEKRRACFGFAQHKGRRAKKKTKDKRRKTKVKNHKTSVM